MLKQIKYVLFGMIRLAKPEPGEMVIDPMCGGGSISIEVRMTFLDVLYQVVDDRLLLVGHCVIILLEITMI